MTQMKTPRSVSIRHLTVALAALAGLSSAPLGAQTIASWNFDSDTVDSAPVGFTHGFTTTALTTPGGSLSSPTNASGAIVLAGNNNTLGAGDTSIFDTPDNKFVRFYDNGTGNLSLRNTDALTGTASLQMLSFDFMNTQYPAATGLQASGLFLAISLDDAQTPQANSAATTTNAARIELFRFSSTVGRISVTHSSSATGSISSSAVTTSDFSLASAHKLRVVINDAGTAASYSIGATTTTLAANRYAVWINNTLIINDRLMRSNHTGGTEGFSRFALGTTNGTGVDWAVDNISVSAIPEPSSFAFIVGLGAVGMVALRRRRAAA